MGNEQGTPQIKERKGNVSETAARDMKQEEYSIGGRWPKGKIYYNIEIKDNGLLKKVNNAIKEWNDKNTPHCQFIEADEDSKYWVDFI